MMMQSGQLPEGSKAGVFPLMMSLSLFPMGRALHHYDSLRAVINRKQVGQEFLRIAANRPRFDSGQTAHTKALVCGFGGR